MSVSNVPCDTCSVLRILTFNIQNGFDCRLDFNDETIFQFQTIAVMQVFRFAKFKAERLARIVPLPEEEVKEFDATTFSYRKKVLNITRARALAIALT